MSKNVRYVSVMPEMFKSNGSYFIGLYRSRNFKIIPTYQYSFENSHVTTVKVTVQNPDFE